VSKVAKANNNKKSREKLAQFGLHVAKAGDFLYDVFLHTTTYKINCDE
jgi:hypothetical protein